MQRLIRGLTVHISARRWRCNEGGEFTGGQIKALEGTALYSLEPYTVGTWYHVKLVVNTSSQTFDLHGNGREKVTGAAFRTSASSINSLAFHANGTNYGNAYVDNVTVYQ